MIEIQLYARNNEIRVLKQFQKIANPLSLSYGLFHEMKVTSRVNFEKVKAFASAWSDSECEKTIFPDVFTIKLAAKTFKKMKFPSWIQSIEIDPNFKEIADHFFSLLKKEGVIILPDLPEMSDSLKRRINLECMIEGIKGHTILTNITSSAAELPAVTVFSTKEKTVFSHGFLRKKYAPYQTEFVNLYLNDCQIKRDLILLDFAREGRSSPDLMTSSEEKLVNLITEINKKRGRPLGFLNFALYQNAFLFKRKTVESGMFPTTFSVWSANRGLGSPRSTHFSTVLMNLPMPKKGAISRAFYFIVNLLRTSLMLQPF